VQCFGNIGSENLESSCQELLDRMDVSVIGRVFAESGTPPVIRIPKTIASGMLRGNHHFWSCSWLMGESRSGYEVFLDHHNNWAVGRGELGTDLGGCFDCNGQMHQRWEDWCGGWSRSVKLRSLLFRVIEVPLYLHLRSMRCPWSARQNFCRYRILLAFYVSRD